MQKPVKKVMVIKKEVWDCGNEDHNHLTEKSAVKCIERKPKNTLLPIEIRGLKWIFAMRLVLTGFSIKEASIKSGLRYGRVVGDIYHLMRLMHRLGRRDHDNSVCFRNYSNYIKIYDVRNDAEEWLSKLDKLEDSWLKKLC